MSILAQALASQIGPYLGEILESRIVDHNLDVSDPPNGYYVRYENGWQMCYRNVTGHDFSQARTNYELAASFASGRAGIGIGFASSGGPVNHAAYADTSVGTDANTSIWAVMTAGSHSLTASIVLFAVGRWK